jgi:hypothetical protein
LTVVGLPSNGCLPMQLTEGSLLPSRTQISIVRNNPDLLKIVTFNDCFLNWTTFGVFFNSLKHKFLSALFVILFAMDCCRPTQAWMDLTWIWAKYCILPYRLEFDLIVTVNSQVPAGPSLLLSDRAEHFWFGPVLDQNKQPN